MTRFIASLTPLLLLVSFPAGATVMLKMELPQLVGRADVIVVGKVVKLESRWSEDRRHIVTDATLEVLQNVRGGTVGRPLVVRSLGGVVDGIGMRVTGSPQLRVGQEVLLFTDLRRGHRYVTGMMQGVFQVQREPNQPARVRASSTGLVLTRRAPGGLQPVREPPPAAEPLDSFVGRIQQTIASCATERARCQ